MVSESIFLFLWSLLHLVLSFYATSERHQAKGEVKEGNCVS